MRPELPFLWLVSEESLPSCLTDIVRNDCVDWLLFYHGCFCGGHARSSSRYNAVTQNTKAQDYFTRRLVNSKIQCQGHWPCY